jgi:hypothetical protein
VNVSTLTQVINIPIHAISSSSFINKPTVRRYTLSDTDSTWSCNLLLTLVSTVSFRFGSRRSFATYSCPTGLFLISS